MKKSIWKFPLGIQDLTAISMPKGAEILTVQMQDSQPCLWALVDTEAEKEPRQFQLVGTGHPVSNGVERKYIGTFQVAGGALVFHLFEIKEKDALVNRIKEVELG